MSAFGAERCIPDIPINAVDTALHLINGVYYYNGSPYNGYVETYYSNGKIEEKSPYASGKLEGISYEWFTSGTLQSARLYVKGEKDGTHYGWYADGQKRFEYNFANGLTEGMCTDWYPDGNKWREAKFKNGDEVRVKAWRTNGKLYANYEIKEGVIYGLNNSNLCYSLTDGQGKYMPAKK